MIQYAGLWLPDGEAHLITQIAKGPKVDGIGTYQLAKLELALFHVKRRRVAVDIGAHAGTWSRILAKHFERVEAFEPKPEHCECFKRNVLDANVVLHKVALGAAAAGEVRLTTQDGHSMHTFVVPHGETVAEMRTLDSFELGDVDFVKIDVEGYERQVLLGALETLKRWRPVLVVEQKVGNGRIYEGDDYAALKLLEKIGARRAAQKSGDFVMVWS
jgi:FkbM family methyltransferase